MTTGHVLLGLLSRGQQHGYDLKREHDVLFPAAKELAFGQVYAALGRLQDKGFVEEAARERVDGPDRTTYRLTEAGRDELAGWLALSRSAPGAHGQPRGHKVTLLLLTEGTHRAVEHLVRERAVRVERMRRLTAAKQRTGHDPPGGPRDRPHPGAPGRRPALDRLGSPPDPRPRGGDRMTAPVLSCRGVVHDYDGTPGIARSGPRRARGRGARHHRPLGLGQVDPPAVPGRHPRPARGVRPPGGVDLRAVGSGTVRRYAASRSASSSSTARSCPS